MWHEDFGEETEPEVGDDDRTGAVQEEPSVGADMTHSERVLSSDEADETPPPQVQYVFMYYVM